jgi:hypothetical protein
MVGRWPRGLLWAIAALLFASCVAGGGSGGTLESSPVPPSGSGGAGSSGPLPGPTTEPGASAGGVPVQQSPLAGGGSGAGSGVASPGIVVTVGPSGRPTVAPPTVIPSVPPLEAPDLRYRLVDTLGRPLFCDPDVYPVARGDEEERAASVYPGIVADAATFRLIVAHLAITPTESPSPQVVLAVYRAWKMLAALKLAPSGDGYVFDYIAANGGTSGSGGALGTGEALASGGTPAGWHVWGTIERNGTITLEGREPAGPPPCPICLARGSRIATPLGERAVETIRVGDLVWTSDGVGGRRAVPVVLVGSTPVPPEHEMVHLVTADGRSLVVSPGHPLADGRPVGSLRVGDPIDGSWVVSVARASYGGGFTFDLLPAGTTATYWAEGILLRSTLSPLPLATRGSETAAGW